MLFDLTFPCYLTTFSGKIETVEAGRLSVLFFVPLIEVLLYMIIVFRLFLEGKSKPYVISLTWLEQFTVESLKAERQNHS
jgi:hypothetical protein